MSQPTRIDIEGILFEFPGDTLPTLIDCRRMKVDEVRDWAATIIPAQHAHRLYEHEVSGPALLQVTDPIQFERWGIPGGPSVLLFDALGQVRSSDRDESPKHRHGRKQKQRLPARFNSHLELSHHLGMERLPKK